MTSSTLADVTVRPKTFSPSGSASSSVRVSMPVLAAVTDDELAASTLAVAGVLGGQQQPTVLYVFEIRRSLPEAEALATEIAAELSDPHEHRHEELKIRKRLRIATGASARWPLEIAVGDVPDCIIEAARRHRSELILVGLHQHNIISRLIGADTVGHLVSFSARPVLAVRENLMARPRRIVVGVDFTPASLRAAHLARRLVADDGVIYLVFVRGDTHGSMSGKDIAWRTIEMRGVEASFDALTREMHPRNGMTIVSATAVGDPAEHLDRFCSRAEADLLAIGSQRLRLRERLRIGGVTTSLLHHATCSVLVAPPIRARAPTSED
jgi:universal stress protein E